MLQKQSQDSEETDLTSDAAMKLDMNQIQSIFCKGKCNFRNRNIMVKSGSPAEDERFSLTDNKRTRVFTVSITDLRSEDEGQYWCAVERTLTTDVYSEILLIIKQSK